jgi:hypothetical protein
MRREDFLPDPPLPDVLADELRILARKYPEDKDVLEQASGMIRKQACQISLAREALR